MEEEVKEVPEAQNEVSNDGKKRCIGEPGLCHDGKPKVCNTVTGEYECPGILA